MAYTLDPAAAEAALQAAMSECQQRQQAGISDPMGGATGMSAPPTDGTPWVPEPPGDGGVT